MPDIIHRIGVSGSSPEAVYDSLTTLDGLAGWWARDTTGDPTPGGTVAFRFRAGGFDMRVLDAVPGEQVRWVVVDGPAEWVGTTVTWDIHQEGAWTILRFAHRGWAEPVEFMSHCSTKWATFLISLKGLLESGQGAPDPDDLAISDWH